MPGLIANKFDQKIDIDFTLRKVFGKAAFRLVQSLQRAIQAGV